MAFPGLGKSLFTIWLTAQVTAGNIFLFPRGSVLLVTGEDALASTVVPRLRSAGADVDQVHILEVTEGGSKDGVRLPDDVHLIAEMLETIDPRPVLVIVDPLNAHLSPKVNSWQDHSVRTALAPLHHLAEDAGCGSSSCPTRTRTKAAASRFIVSAARSGLEPRSAPRSSWHSILGTTRTMPTGS